MTVKSNKKTAIVDGSSDIVSNAIPLESVGYTKMYGNIRAIFIRRRINGSAAAIVYARPSRTPESLSCEQTPWPDYCSRAYARLKIGRPVGGGMASEFGILPLFLSG